MTPDRYKALRLKSLEIAVQAGLAPSVRYLRANGIKPTKHQIAEIKLTALQIKRNQASIVKSMQLEEGVLIHG